MMAELRDLVARISLGGVGLRNAALFFLSFRLVADIARFFHVSARFWLSLSFYLISRSKYVS